MNTIMNEGGAISAGRTIGARLGPEYSFSPNFPHRYDITHRIAPSQQIAPQDLQHGGLCF